MQARLTTHGQRSWICAQDYGDTQWLQRSCGVITYEWHKECRGKPRPGHHGNSSNDERVGCNFEHHLYHRPSGLGEHHGGAAQISTVGADAKQTNLLKSVSACFECEQSCGQEHESEAMCIEGRHCICGA